MIQEKEPKGFDKARKKTETLLKDDRQLKSLIKKASSKAKSKKNELKEVWRDLQTLIRLIKAWRKKEYQDIPWKTILYASAAVVYFVSPLDLIPDFIPLAGFIDDISVITFVINALKNDLTKFKEWEKLSLNEE